MKSSTFKGVLVCAALSCFAAFGTLAQDQKKEVTEQDIKKWLRDTDTGPLKEWTVLDNTGSVKESRSGSPEGQFRVRSYETDEPYADTMKFYAAKCRMPSPSEDIEKAAIYKLNSGHGFGFKGGSLSVSNLSDAQSSTFVRLYPDHALTITLYRPLRTKRTHVTITRIDLSAPANLQ